MEEVEKKPSTKVENEGDETSSNEAGEEDCCHDFTPIVQLKEVEPVRTDIEEDIVWENKCKLYRFDAGAWKERGLGIAKILKHKTTHKQRFVMHEDKTFKLRSNHLILPSTTLQEHGGNPKALVFSTIDFSEGNAKEESLCIRLGTPEKAEEFRMKYEAATKENAQYIQTKPSEATPKDTETSEEAIEKMTEALGNTKVEEGTAATKET